MTVDLTVPEVHLHIGGEARTSWFGRRAPPRLSGDWRGPGPRAACRARRRRRRGARRPRRIPGLARLEASRSAHEFFVGSAS